MTDKLTPVRCGCGGEAKQGVSENSAVSAEPYQYSNRSAEERKDNRMKTLDEVIKAFEICIGYYCSNAEHDVCPYFGESDMGCMKEPEKDALHYLKDMKNLEVDYDILYKKYWREFNQQQENPALTWDELRTMEGKPVWVESSDSFNRRRWMFVGEWFDDDEMRLFDMGNDYPDYVSKNGYESGTWQAYRKERA